MSPDKIQVDFLMAAERGDETALRKLFENGADINIADSETGLTALHLAVGRNSMKAARFLVEHGALFTPDRFGRLPTTIAAESEVSEKLCDFIGKQKRQPRPGPRAFKRSLSETSRFTEQNIE